LYCEGRAFRQEVPLLEKSMREGWPLRVEFMADAAGDWPPLTQTFTIHHVANPFDTASNTCAFFVPLANQSRSVEKDGKARLLWRVPPGPKKRVRPPMPRLVN